MMLKRIKDLKEYLINENIYTEKDELTLMLLDNTYVDYLRACKDVKQNGQTIIIYDMNKKEKKVRNPEFTNKLELQKELFKLLDSLYLSPKSRKTKPIDKNEIEDPFKKMFENINKIDNETKEESELFNKMREDAINKYGKNN